MSLKSLIKSIGEFFANLFSSTGDAFDALPKDQQSDIINGIQVSQVIKLFYKQGETAVIKEVAERLNVSENVAIGVVDHALKAWGINETSIDAGLKELQDIIDKGISDGGWNSLFKTLADNAAIFLGTGRVNWITLSFGVLEFAYQKLFKNVK